MTPTQFDEANVQLAKDQPQYQTLPVFFEPDAPGAPMTSCFELTAEEIAEIVATGKIWHRQLTFGSSYHPILLSTKKPF